MKIKKEVLQNIVNLCASSPVEVGGLLLGNPIEDFVLLPGKLSASSIYIQMDQLPIYTNLFGTFHSHLRGVPQPSRADLDLFGRIGKEHMIIATPVGAGSIGVFTSKGKPVSVEIIK